MNKLSLWFDESIPLMSTTDYVKEELFSGKFYCPIAYDAFIHYYSKFIGNSEFILRISSVIFGTVSVAILYCLGNLLFNSRAGLFSAFILAISPFHIYYSRELRMYSLVSLLVLLSIYALIKAVKENKKLYWLSYIIFNSIAIYMHPFTLFILIAEILFFLLYIKKYNHIANRWIKIHIIMLILLIPWIISMLFASTLAADKNNWFFEYTLSWIPKATWHSIFYTFKNFSIGYNAVRQIYLLASLLFFILFLLGIKACRKHEGAILSLLCLFTPILSAYFLSKFCPCYMDRYFIPSSLFYYLIIGKGLSSVRKKYTIMAVTCIIFLSSASLKNYYADYLPGSFAERVAVQAKKGHREAAKYLAENFLKGDIIFHTCRNTVPSFEYYFNKIYGEDTSIKKDLVLRFSENDNILLPFEYDTESHIFINRSRYIELDKKERIWIIFSGWDYNLATQPGSPELEIVQWMDKHYFRKDSKAFSGITVYLYKKI